MAIKNGTPMAFLPCINLSSLHSGGRPDGGQQPDSVRAAAKGRGARAPRRLPAGPSPEGRRPQPSSRQAGDFLRHCWCERGGVIRRKNTIPWPWRGRPAIGTAGSQSYPPGLCSIWSVEQIPRILRAIFQCCSFETRTDFPKNARH